MALVLGVVCACAQTGDPQAELRRPQDTPERPAGCIDTPYIAGDVHATTSGIRCGRKDSKEPVLIRGRVSAQDGRGLPGPALEGVWVTLHALEGGPLRIEALPPARAEVQTGPQGAFSLASFGAGEYVLVVRLEPTGPGLGARRFEPEADDRTPELSLVVPLDARVQAHLDGR